MRSPWVCSVGERGLVRGHGRRVQELEEAAAQARCVFLSSGLEMRCVARQMHWMLGLKKKKNKKISGPKQYAWWGHI